MRQLYTGFTDGYNAYLRSGKLRDPRCKGKPWVRPITLTDMFLRGEQIVTEGSSQQFISGFVSAAPPATTAQSVHATRAAGSTLDLAALKAQFGDSTDRAQVKGIFKAIQLPHAFRRDYVENCNDSYWLAIRRRR